MRTKTHHIQQSHLIISNGQPGIFFFFDPSQSIDKQTEHRRIRTFLFVGEAQKEFHHVGGIPGLHQIIVQGEECVDRFHLRNDEQVASLCELDRDVRERLEMTRLARGHFPCSLCQRTHHALVTGIKREQSVSFAPIGMAKDNCGSAKGTEVSHEKSENGE